MSGVRVLVGTRKGAFVLTSDGMRTDWEIDGPHFPGWEIYHAKGSPADPDRIYVLATIDEVDVGRLRLDQPVTITVDAFPSRQWRGTVAAISRPPARTTGCRSPARP